MTDWICPSCDAQISASEDKCFCGTGRPSPDTIRFATAEKDPPKIVIGFVKTVLRLGMLAWVSFLCLWAYFAFTRPSTSSLGRLYALKSHGKIAYLTHKEEIQLYGLGTVALGLFAIGVIAGVTVKQRYGRRANFW